VVRIEADDGWAPSEMTKAGEPEPGRWWVPGTMVPGQERTRSPLVAFCVQHVGLKPSRTKWGPGPRHEQHLQRADAQDGRCKLAGMVTSSLRSMSLVENEAPFSHCWAATDGRARPDAARAGGSFAVDASVLVDRCQCASVDLDDRYRRPGVISVTGRADDSNRRPSGLQRTGRGPTLSAQATPQGRGNDIRKEVCQHRNRFFKTANRCTSCRRSRPNVPTWRVPAASPAVLESRMSLCSRPSPISRPIALNSAQQ
jgi:hypothetical protein